MATKAKTKATEDNSSALAIPLESYAIMQGDPEAILAPIRDNLAGEQITERDLDRIRIPTGGRTQWEIPSLIEGEEEYAKSIEGVVVFTKIARAYWTESFESSGGGTPPECKSVDGAIGDGDPGGECAACVFNEFDEDSGRKPCKTTRLLFLAREEDILPSVVVLSPGSLAQWKTFALRMASKGMSYHGVVISISLTKAKNRNGIEYAQAQFKVVTKLEADQHARVKAYGETLGHVFRSAGVQLGDVD